MVDPMIILQGITAEDFWKEMEARTTAIVEKVVADFNSKQEDEKLLTIKEACSTLRITRPTLDSFCKTGKINKLIVGSKTYLKKSEVESLIITKNYLRPTI